MLWNAVLSGAIATVSAVIALVFLRFWCKSRDRFFLFFSAAFVLEAIGRLLVVETLGVADETPLFYLVRLSAYALILIAIVDKNRRRPPAPH
jgi:hypothetical protein